MSFSSTAYTGWSAEAVVKDLFMSWGWNVATDEIDAGHDFCVTPDADRFGGLNFYVQVKGTASPLGRDALVAQVCRRRLSQYARCETPVFIVRVGPDKAMRWLHVQEWAKTNSAKLKGNGRAKVRLSGKSLVSDRSAFETALMASLAPRRPGANAVLALRDEAQHLNALDPRLKVKVSANEWGKSYVVDAVAEAVQADFSFQLAPGEDNAEALRRALTFGVAAKVNAQRFALAGSPVFQRIAPDPIDGSIELRAQPSGEGRLRFRCTKDGGPALFSTSAHRFVGMGGAAINNFHSEALLQLELRLLLNDEKPVGSFSLRLNGALLAQHQLRDLTELQGLAEWAESALEGERLDLEAEFDGLATPLTLKLDEFERVKLLLRWLCHLGRLREIARLTGSTLRVTDPSEFAVKDWAEVRLVHRLLRGEEIPQKVEGLRYVFAAEAAPVGVYDLIATDHLRFTVMDQWLADVSVRTDLIGYVVSKRDDGSYVAEPGPSASATMRRMVASDPYYSKAVEPQR